MIPDERLRNVLNMGFNNIKSIKSRRQLKGHQAKILCCDWSPDKRHIVSSSQVRLPQTYLTDTNYSQTNLWVQVLFK